MKYFLDQEFTHGFYKPLFGKRRYYIDLISIGIVSETGKTLYYVSSEYNFDDADDWVKKNVLLPLYTSMVRGDQRNRLTVRNFNKALGMTNAEIAEQVALFCNCSRNTGEWVASGDVEFYGYYADYDWVLFASLFGGMLSLPKGFPIYCRDLKQMIDDLCIMKRDKIAEHLGRAGTKTLNDYLTWYKGLSDYPKNENEHLAIDDAKWNLELYKFIHRHKKEFNL